MTVAHYELELDGKPTEVKVLGTCVRDGLGNIVCEVERVIHDGRNIIGDIPEAHMAPMRNRLWYARIADGHPLGDSVEAAV